ncbi:hypothetical protein [Kitasatospora cheerisanensis]|uniref:Uncharacterized protein n=1 Tax=Kitasatospora cheerisanensis KCTC 2395 TaxID=1348663 RepID=A0A066YVX4_9ACTN|nr:hypothetical protein [Kitasatospora cheerisanensis]KDN85668.1 hypothetical protein KCH_25770 [Kitasatospora cheerisanensis KCTC 2395]
MGTVIASSPLLGLWPSCGHQGAEGRVCTRLRGHRERADGTGPLIHRDKLHAWEEQPAAPWWTDFELDGGS